MSKILTRTAGTVKLADEWRTPPECFAALDREFGFDCDLAATADNHLCEHWLGPGGWYEDALAVGWHTLSRCAYLNMPYSSIGPWMEKAVMESQQGLTIVCLVPHSSDTAWWNAWTRYAVEIREIPHRVPYLRADGVTRAGAMFASCVIVYRPQPGVRQPAWPRRVVWSWRELTTKPIAS